MVARQTGSVKPLFGVLLGVLLLWPGASAGKRRLEPVEISESGVRGVDDVEEETRFEALPFELGPAEEHACRLDLAAGHQGHGTLADVFFEGPAGVRVDLLSGNLVWQRQWLPHGMPVTRLAFTLAWNARHERRADAALPSGWRHRFDTAVVPGSWGVMLVLEPDGFVHRFYAMVDGVPYDRDELVEEIVQRRREVGVPPGESLPSGRRFVRQLEQDDVFLGAMRSRFLGGGAWVEGAYVSEARGHQLLQVAPDGSAALLRGDGTVERFDAAGRLVSIEPVGAPPVSVTRSMDAIQTVHVTQGPSLDLEYSGRGELVRVRGAAGREVRLERERGVLTRVRTPAGDWLFGHDEAGALTSIQGPEGWARIRYDGDRVVAVEGPLGETTFERENRGDTLWGRARGPAGAVEVELDLVTGERVVRGPAGERRVRFDGGFNRPLQVGPATLTYDRWGRVVVVDHPAGRLEVQADDSGVPTRLIGPGRRGFRVAVDGEGRPVEVEDDDGVRLQYRYDSDGTLGREGTTLGATSLEHNAWGELTQVGLAGGDRIYLERDRAGRPVRYRTSGGLQMRLDWDDADRLTSLRTADLQDVEVVHTAGSLRVVDPRGQVLGFGCGTHGRVETMERTGEALRLTVQRDAAARPAALSGDGWTARFEHRTGRLVRARGLPSGDLECRWREDSGGGALAEIDMAGGRWQFTYESDSGRAVGATGPGVDLGLTYDPGGRLQSIASGVGLPWRVESSPAGRPQQVDPGTGTPAALSRDRAGRVVEAHDGEQALLRLSRDGQGRASAVQVREGEGWGLALGLHGWPQGLIGPQDARFAVELDVGARVAALAWPDGTTAAIDWTVRGDLHRVAGDWGELVYGYDPAGRVTELVSPGARFARYDWGPGRVTLGDGRELGFTPQGALRHDSGAAEPAPTAPAALDDVAWALLQPWLPRPPVGSQAPAGVGAPLPRWAVDRAWSFVDTGWAAVLAAPPGAGLAVPDPAAGEPVTVVGLLALLGFGPGDLGGHRQLVPQPAPVLLVRCPAVHELRALFAGRRAAPFDVGLGVVTAEPSARGVALQPDGAAVAHPTPWAAAHDPLGLRWPGVEILGQASPSAGATAASMELARWLSDRRLAALDPAAGLAAEPAGAFQLWSAGRVQAVVDDRGRLRGVDVGATAVNQWNRALVAAFLGGALGGQPPVLDVQPRWMPSPGGVPEVSVGLWPGPGAVWPDPWGRLHEVRP